MANMLILRIVLGYCRVRNTPKYVYLKAYPVLAKYVAQHTMYLLLEIHI